jgi:hypothetical protein
MDHGILNIPGRTGTINAELDRYKATQAKQARAARKTKAAETRALRAEAAGLIEVMTPERLQAIADHCGVAPKEAKAALHITAFWNPAALIKAEAKAAPEQAETPKGA